jgi:ABC-type glutathione transport system ATPase component
MHPPEKRHADADIVHCDDKPSPHTTHPAESPHRPQSPPIDTLYPLQPTASHAQNAFSLRKVDPVSVQLDRLSVFVDESPNALAKLVRKSKKRPHHDPVKTILDNVSAALPSGTLTAIIGGSGSGKTSLLNQMSGRMKGARISTSGRTLFNGSEDASRINSAYVIQQDILLPTLTVRETLMYAAQLRLPSSVSRAEKKQLVEQVIIEVRVPHTPVMACILTLTPILFSF